MNNTIFFNYLRTCCCCAAAVMTLAACEENNPVSEWEAEYIYIERPSLGVSTVECPLYHRLSGVTGERKFPITVKLSAPHPFAVEVGLAVDLGEGLDKGFASFRNEGSVIVPAGETFGRDTMLLSYESIKDVPEAAKVYHATVRIATAAPLSDRLRVSTKMPSLDFRFSKGFYANAAYDQEPQGKSVENRSEWEVKVQKQPDAAWAVDAKLTDGNTRTNVYGFGYLGLMADLKQEMSLSGVQIHRGTNKNFAASECVVETSVDGQTWAVQHTRDAISRDKELQSIAFFEPVRARYVRLSLYGAGRVTSTELYVWIPAATSAE